MRSRPVRHFSEEELSSAISYMKEGRLPDGRVPTSRAHYGRFSLLEDVADEMIRKSLEGVTKYSEKSDILTTWKEEMRQRREVYNLEGVADPRVRRGMYHRVLNPQKPELNARDGVYRARSSGSITMGAFNSYHGFEGGDEE